VPPKARELWKFGKWLFGSNIIGYLLNEGDDWFVWFYLGGGPLKLYRYAYNFSNLPATHITNTISQVSFPAYSKIQNDIPRLREAYLKVVQVTALVSIPTAFLIFSLGPDFVRLFLVEESHAMVPVIQILAFYGLLKSLGATRGPLFRAMGKPQAPFYLFCLRIGILVASIYPLTKHWGIAGTAIATMLPAILINPLGFLLVCRLLNCSILQLLQQSIYPFFASIIMALLLLLIKYFFASDAVISYAFFFVLCILSVILYFGFMWLADIFMNYGFRQVINKQIRSLRNKAGG